MSPLLQIVVPCYNEAPVLPDTVRELDELIGQLAAAGTISAASGVTYVDDGSRDDTWALIERESQQRTRVAGIRLSRNQGHQIALLAGLMTVAGDVIVSIDADLQDDPAAIAGMLEEYQGGCDIVYGVREDRSSDTAFKRGSARLYYRLLARLGVELVHDHADFRLLSRRAIEALRDYKEVNLYLRGVVPLIGLRQTCVGYVRRARQKGESKYPLRRMLALALDGVTSFSSAPLQAIFWLGLAVFIVSLATSVWVLWVALFTHRAVPGWASTLLPTLFLGGVQILSIGVIGAYLGKLYREVKARPRYLIDQTVGMRARGPSDPP
jgi:polyisoprenyl-phosphate glycosyltransferase